MNFWDFFFLTDYIRSLFPVIMKMLVFTNFVCIPVTSDAQANFPCEPGFGSGREAELFVHLERVKADVITFQVDNARLSFLFVDISGEKK